MAKNIELLRKTLEHMKKFPEKHDQGNWIAFDDEVWPPKYSACNTTMCTAGHAAALAGAEVPNYGQIANIGWRLDKNGKLSESGTHVSEWAAAELGMNDEEQNYIFLCMNEEGVFDRIEELLKLWENGEEFSYTTEEDDEYDDDLYCGCDECH